MSTSNPVPLRLRDVYGPLGYTKQDLETFLREEGWKPVGLRLVKPGETYVCASCRRIIGTSRNNLHTLEAGPPGELTMGERTRPMLVVTRQTGRRPEPQRQYRAYSGAIQRPLWADQIQATRIRTGSLFYGVSVPITDEEEGGI